MRLEHVGPDLTVRLHAAELSGLIAVARWATDGNEGELPAEARVQLRAILRSYDAELARYNRGRARGRHGTSASSGRLQSPSSGAEDLGERLPRRRTGCG